jgi:hypothetical protein
MTYKYDMGISLNDIIKQWLVERHQKDIHNSAIPSPLIIQDTQTTSSEPYEWFAYREICIFGVSSYNIKGLDIDYNIVILNPSDPEFFTKFEMLFEKSIKRIDESMLNHGGDYGDYWE